MTSLGNILKIGKECGLVTCGEAILNMERHWDAFSQKEYSKIVEEYNELYNKGLISCNTKIDDMKILMK